MSQLERCGRVEHELVQEDNTIAHSSYSSPWLDIFRAIRRARSLASRLVTE